jgi:hypothetical protein
MTGDLDVRCICGPGSVTIVRTLRAGASAPAGAFGWPIWKICWQLPHRTFFPSKLSCNSRIFKQLGQVT